MCNATTPDEREDYGETCTSQPNSCGDTNEGTYNMCLDDGTM
jgi:hypothetical protein